MLLNPNQQAQECGWKREKIKSEDNSNEKHYYQWITYPLHREKNFIEWFLSVDKLEMLIQLSSWPVMYNVQTE